MKNTVKDTIGHFKVLIEHSLKDYESAPSHILKRMVKPLCKDISKLLKDGTKNDSWIVLEGFSRECQKAFSQNEGSRQD